jgi:hypothetical protein
MGNQARQNGFVASNFSWPGVRPVVTDGAIVEPRNIAPRAGAAIPLDQQPLEGDALHGASQSGRRRALYPAGAGQLRKEKAGGRQGG